MVLVLTTSVEDEVELFIGIEIVVLEELEVEES